MRDTVNVDRIGAIVKVLDRTFRAKKVGAIEVEPAANARFELLRPCIPTDGLQRAKVIAGVKIINPALRGCLAVIP